MKIPAGGAAAHSVTFPLLMPLSADPGMGTGTDPIYNSEAQALRQFVAYFNDYDKSVNMNGSGIEFLDGKPYGLMEKATDQISTFLKELFGYWVRYCLINGYSPNLQATPTSLSVVPHPNTLVVGAVEGNQPAEIYSSTSAIMASRIAACMAGIPAGTSGALNVNMILASASYLTYKKALKPVTYKGESLYFLTVPTSQKDYLLNPGNSGQLGATWQAVSRFNDKMAADLPQYLGQVGNVILVEDPRAPTAKVYGSGSGSNTSSASNAIYTDFYLKPGLNDPRSTGDLEACFFLGQGAVADLEPEAPHFETETQYLKKSVVKGALGSRGFNRMDYEKSTPTSTSKINQSSAVIWCRKQTSSFG
jgi:hypothetical protein